MKRRNVKIKWGTKGKTVWDFGQLLLLPLLIPISGYIFQVGQQRGDATRYREEALQTYYEDISSLIFEEKLKESTSGEDEVSNIARAKTLAVLRQLDNQREGFLILFLREAKLITIKERQTPTGIISLSGARLNGVVLNDMELQDVSFWYADLSGAQLQNSDLRRANFENSDLRKANLRGANLEDANLKNAKLKRTKLHNTKFCRTIMPDGSLKNDSCGQP